MATKHLIRQGIIRAAVRVLQEFFSEDKHDGNSSMA